VNTEITGVKSPQKLFGTSGIRGRVDDFLTPEFAVRAGLSFAALLENKGAVLVGRDVRVSSQLVENALISGLLAGGLDTLACGVVPTPAMLFAVKKLHYSGGVMVTGSHTPASTTGMLFFLADTGEMSERGELRFEELFRSEQLKRMSWSEVGSSRNLDILETYYEELHKELGNISGYRVVVDPGNGATWRTLGAVLENAGCQVVTINGRPDGTFPARSPYPQPSTLAQLARAVKDARADLGVGVDSDGDRALFAKSGNVLWGDITCAIFVKNELRNHKGGRIITTINTSNVIRLLCQEYGGTLTVTRVGPPAMAQALRDQKNALIATEESGKYIWPQILMYGDAALATGRLLQIMRREQKSLEELEREIPRFHQFKSTIPCPEQLKSRAIEFAVDLWKDAKGVEVSTIDGVKVNYPNNSSFLLRASGTEPTLRCYAESLNLNEATKLLERVNGLAHDALTKATGG
jgi:phosphomannomutase/phosphoglucomutase